MIIFIRTEMIQKDLGQENGRLLPGARQKINKLAYRIIFSSCPYCGTSWRDNGQNPYRQHQTAGHRQTHREQNQISKCWSPAGIYRPAN